MASGDTLLTFFPQDNEPPSSNAASLDLRNNHPVLDFDDTTNESCVFSAIIPQFYDGNGFDVILHVSFTTAISGDSDWDVSVEKVGTSQDVDSDDFATAVSVDNTTVPGTSGQLQKITVALTDPTQIDSAVAGDKIRIKITRDAASDTATGDAELHCVEIQET